MEKRISIFIASFLALLFFANNLLAQENDLKKIISLMSGKWKYYALVKDFEINQEVIIESGLRGELLKGKTWGICDLETYEYGLRAEFMVASDKKETNKIIYWSYDILTGIHTGEATLVGKDIHFEFNYTINGEKVLIHDIWTYVDENTFRIPYYIKRGDELELILEGKATRIIE